MKILRLSGLNGIVQFTNKKNRCLPPRLQFMLRPPQTQPVKDISLLPPWLTSICMEISVPSSQRYNHATHQPIPKKLQTSPGEMEAGSMPNGMTRIGDTGAWESFQGRNDPDN